MILSIKGNLIAKFQGYFLYRLYFRADTTGSDVIINQVYLPTDLTLSHQVSIEQKINLAWPVIQ